MMPESPDQIKYPQSTNVAVLASGTASIASVWTSYHARPNVTDAEVSWVTAVGAVARMAAQGQLLL